MLAEIREFGADVFRVVSGLSLESLTLNRRHAQMRTRCRSPLT